MPRMTPVPAQRGQATWLLFAQSGFQTLATQFQEAEAGKFAHLHAGAVFFERVAQDVFNIALVLGVSMSMKSMTTKPPKSRRRI